MTAPAQSGEELNFIFHGSVKMIRTIWVWKSNCKFDGFLRNCMAGNAILYIDESSRI